MPRSLNRLSRVGTALVGLLFLLSLGEARMVTSTLTHTPVTGHLAEGGTFDGLLTVRELTVDGSGHLAATGVLAGTATPTPGTATAVPPGCRWSSVCGACPRRSVSPTALSVRWRNPARRHEAWCGRPTPTWPPARHAIVSSARHARGRVR
jgi:hypothetical protein